MGFAELLVIALVALLIVGPEKLPETIRTGAKWFMRLKQQFSSIKKDVEDELGIDEIRRDLHNSKIMADLEKLETAMNDSTHLGNFVDDFPEPPIAETSQNHKGDIKNSDKETIKESQT